jgi:ABC-type phosphate transport system permease subunit
MLLLMKNYSCNIAICVIGAVINAFLAAILFLISLLLTGAGFMPALAGSALMLSLIAVPAIPIGILFWLIAVFKNTFLRTYWKMEVN